MVDGSWLYCVYLLTLGPKRTLVAKKRCGLSFLFMAQELKTPVFENADWAVGGAWGWFPHSLLSVIMLRSAVVC